MPVYLHCPHCEHPQVVAPHRRGKTVTCRQCGGSYRTAQSVNLVQAVSDREIDDLREARRAPRTFHLVEV